MSATHPDGRPKERLPELDLGAPSADRSVIPGLAELQDHEPTVAVGSTLKAEPAQLSSAYTPSDSAYLRNLADDLWADGRRDTDRLHSIAHALAVKSPAEPDPVSISILRDDLEAARLRVSELEDENMSWRELLLESGLQLIDASRAEGSRARAQSEAGVMCLKAAWGIT